MVTPDKPDSKLIETLTKVLALCDSPNEGEAANAAGHLARLLEKHNLTVAELEAAGQEVAAIIEKRIPLSKGAPSGWRTHLALDLAETYFCQVMLGSAGPSRRTSALFFVGRPDNVATLNAVYEFLVKQLCRMSRESRREHIEIWNEVVNANQWQASFCAGAIYRIGERLEAERATRGSQVQALVLQRDREAREYVDENYPDLDEREVGANASHPDAIREGAMAGDFINLKPLLDDGDDDTKGRLE